MALGIEQNNLAPQLIASSGAALVQGIRQIGQQISGQLTEMQTKRDLGAIAQELQGVNVQSNEFPVQLAQLVSRHPLAARDERGMAMLGTLGKAHGQWQAGEAEARAFNRAMAMQGARDRSARDFYDYKREKEQGDPVNVGGSLVLPKDPVTGQPKVLFTPPPRVTAGSQRPSVLAPGAMLVDPTGKELAKNPKPPASSASAALSKERFNASLIKDQASSVKSEIEAGIRRLDAVEKEQAKILEENSTNKDKKLREVATQRNAELDAKKHAIIKEVNEKKVRHLKLQETLGALQARMQEAEAVVTDEAGAAVLPPVPATTELPVLTPAQAAQQPSGTQFRDKNGNVRTVP